MKIIRAIFLAELRGHRALALGILTLLGLQGMLQTHWIYDATPMISLSVQAILALLCVLLLSKSLWQDAPLRKERYLATRPTNLLRLYLGKYAAFLAVIAVPSALVEFLRVRYFSFDLNIQAAAALQMFLLYAFAIAGFISVIWWMHSKISIIMLWITLIGAGYTTNYYFGHKTQTYIYEWSAGVPYSDYMILLMLVCFALLATLRLLRLKRIHVLISCVMMAALVFVSIQWAIAILTRKSITGTVQKCQLASFYSNTNRMEKVRTYQARVPFDYSASDFDTDSLWTFHELKLNGKDFTPWYNNIIGIGANQSELFQVIQNRYPQAHNNHANHEKDRTAFASVPFELSKDKLNRIQFTLQRQIYRWKIIMDLPLKVGAKASDQNFSCHIDEVSPRKQLPRIFGDTSSTHQRVAHVSLCNPFKVSDQRLDLNLMHQLVIIEPSTGEIFTTQKNSISELPTTNPGKHYFYSVHCYTIPSSNMSFRYQSYSADARVLILVPEVIEEKYYTWEHSASLSNQVNQPQSDNFAFPSQGSQTPDSWLADHPTPSKEARLKEREAWVNQLIEYAKRNPRFIGVNDDSPILKAHQMHVELFAKAHHEGRLPSGLKEYYFVKSYTRELLQRYPHIAYTPHVIWHFHRNGWSADLVDTARDALRNGENTTFELIILAEPELMKLTQEEWVEFYRMKCHAEAYQALKGRVLSAEVINQITDQYLAIHHDVEFGLARGHAEAPQWMKREALNSSSECISIPSRLKRYFELSEPLPKHAENQKFLEEPVIEWLKKFDPSSYVYDPAKKKYIPKPTP